MGDEWAECAGLTKRVVLADCTTVRTSELPVQYVFDRQLNPVFGKVVQEEWELLIV